MTCPFLHLNVGAAFRRPGRTVAALLAAVALTGCGIDKQTGPSPIGPSEFGLSVTMTATPDQLPRDGSTQSVVTITVRDSSGKPVSGQRLSLSLPTNAPAGATLSQSEVTTGSNGAATVAVMAPQTGSVGNIVITATPVGTNFDNSVARTISIGVIPENSTAPIVGPFTVNPTTPEVGALVTFTAGSATDEGVSCTSCTFSWDFADGSTATGQVVTHTFTQVGDYSVALTVTDRGGAATIKRQTVTVVGVAPPTVSFTVSPTGPITGQEATFTATATPASGHRIATFNWSWGDGSDNQTASPVIHHTYSTAGTYLVVLTVTDDRGLTTRMQTPVVVTSGLTASFAMSTTSPRVNVAVTFNASASASTNGSVITSYAWDFGDGGTSNSSTPFTSHAFASTGISVVVLTVSDAQGRTATLTQLVTVAP
jgi:PKD repeat protein